MRNIFKDFARGAIIGTGIMFSVGIIGVTYAAYDAWLSDVSSGDTFSAVMWNKMQDNQIDFNAKISTLYTQVGAIETKIGVLETQENWISATLQNGWIGNGSLYTYDTPGYYKDALGRVWLRGGLRGGTQGTCVLTLPNGYRPIVPASGISSAWSSGADAQTTRVSITTDGCVKIFQESNQDTNSVMSLDNISFSTH